MHKTTIIERNGHIVEFIPIIMPCTYHYPVEGKACKNCNNTMKWVDGYHMIYEIKGKKYGFIVDNMK